MGTTPTPEDQLKPVGPHLYEAIGSAYPATRRTDPQLAARIWSALGDARTVLNVGAGTGNYEPPDRDVVAVEPSSVMRAQRPPTAAPCIAATAEHLPFSDKSFDAAMAVSTIHHWQNPVAGLREMHRVARRLVIFTHDPSEEAWRTRFWLTRDYLPEAATLVANRPPLAQLATTINAEVAPVPIPWNCKDGFFESHWRHPEAYLNENVRRAVSVWTRVGQRAEQRAVEALATDLTTGRWQDRNHNLLTQETAELGLRLLTT